jgi:thioredoxin-like negative regulator of GroEL
VKNAKEQTSGEPNRPQSSPAPASPPPTAPVSTPALFRRIDWLTFLVSFFAVWLGYFFTLAPELTLEDSGELATGSLYAGIPHPPGYPVWTLYTWLWTVLLPIKNIAWRVALGEATSGAFAAGLLGLIVSRGSSLLMEGIEELKTMTGRWESAICLVSGFVAALLMGFNGFMWSQSVIVEVYSFGVASLMLVLLCLLRWLYAPHQRRYLYLALFFHGLCFTNHQTLVVAALGIEALIAAANFRMGRYLFLGNSIIYLMGLILKQHRLLTALDQNQAIFVIFNVVGVASILLYLWFTILSRENFLEYCLDAALALGCILLCLVPSWGFFALVLALGAFAAVAKLAYDTRKLGLEWLIVIGCGFCWLLGASFYLYMPLAGMTNPPMQWGYPRTVEGFIHAFTRGQYEKANPTDIIHNPGVFAVQLLNMGRGIVDEFNWAYVFLALVPFAFFLKMHRRERAWIIGVSSFYLCLGVLLLILLNPPPDRAAQELNRVFFTASHTLIALLVGYGLTLVAAYMATHYQNFRTYGLIGGSVAIGLALLSFTQVTESVYFGEGAQVSPGTLAAFVWQALTDPDQYALPVFAGLLLIALAVGFVVALLLYRSRAPLALTLGLFALMPLHPFLTHWSDNEQRNHWFGYWFGHDMFKPPFADPAQRSLYPEMAKDAVLFGGTDPGRFCPTYMIFCDSFLPVRCRPEQDPQFDRRDVYIITQNALADGTYLNYIRAHYNRSTQIDPPFFQELFRSEKERQQNYNTNFFARAVRPLDTFFASLGDRIEKQRRTFTSWFSPADFVDLPAFVARLQPGPQRDAVSTFLYENLSEDTRRLLTAKDQDRALRAGLVKDLNQLIDRQPQPERFREIALSDYLKDFIRQNPQSHTRVRLNRLLLEAAYPKELARSLGGVYPDREIYTPNLPDLSKAYNEYMADAQRRMQQNLLKPGENVSYDPASGRMQVGGTVAVMAINGLLTKVIFDRNPQNEFYVEESFPLDWMYPYLTPFGIIMKINREPVKEITDDIVARDHEFWSRYSERLIGNWITYDTKVPDIVRWVEQVYQRRNFRGFKGDRKFIRDDQAQKAFSKLRSSIAGVYAWRINMAKRNSPERQRMIREADFAFRQSFAFCPYSPEAVMRYVNLLMHPDVQRVEDALLIARTCLRLDPFNAGFADLVKRIEEMNKLRTDMNPAELERTLDQNPNNFQAAFNVASAFLQAGQTDRAVAALDRVLKSPRVDANALRALLQAYTTLENPGKIQETVDRLAAIYQADPANVEAGTALAEGYRLLQRPDRTVDVLDQVVSHPKLTANAAMQAAQQFAALNNYPKLEAALEKLVKLAPESPEAWYDLAAMKSILGKNQEALTTLGEALRLSRMRLQQDPKARSLLADLQTDQRFSPLRNLPEFKALLGAP